MNFDKNFWKEQYAQSRLMWDIGYPSPAVTEFIEKNFLENTAILFPGAGNSYEAEYLFGKGFKNIFVLDIVYEPFKNLLKRCPEFPKKNIITEDFFEHTGSYDLIIEQTFFTSFLPEKRNEIADKIYELLKSDGKYAGLFFNHKFNSEFPPFGATTDEYKEIFGKNFYFEKFEIAQNSIKPRQNRELFFVFGKKVKSSE